jgi:predicted metal-dependent hydrolase
VTARFAAGEPLEPSKRSIAAVTDTTAAPPTAPAAQTSTPGWTVPTRRISFAPRLDDLPKHFARDGNLILSHLAASISTIFPDGEEFFVEAVRHFRDGVTDAELKRQVAGFIGQESVHEREHRALNDRLAALGYPTRAFEWVVRHGMRLQTWMRKPEARLAHTAAAEHVTSTVAMQFLSPEAEGLFGDDVGAVCLWHCLEELEHKAVAFDVYRAIGGTEKQRVRSARDARWSSVVTAGVFVTIGLLGDRETYRRGRLRRDWRQFKASPLMRREVWEQLKAYDRPGFHPNDRDTTELVATWRARLFSDTGALTPLLADATG